MIIFVQCFAAGVSLPQFAVLEPAAHGGAPG